MHGWVERGGEDRHRKQRERNIARREIRKRARNEMTARAWREFLNTRVASRIGKKGEVATTANAERGGGSS